MKKYLSWIICAGVIVAILAVTLVCFAMNYSPKVVAKRYLNNLINNRFENCYEELSVPKRFSSVTKDDILKIYENFRADKKRSTKIIKAEKMSSIEWTDVDKIYDSKEAFDKEKAKYRRVVITYKNSLENKSDEQELSYFVNLVKDKNILGFIPKYKVADNLIASYLYDASRIEAVKAVPKPKKPKATPKK